MKDISILLLVYLVPLIVFGAWAVRAAPTLLRYPDRRKEVGLATQRDQGAPTGLEQWARLRPGLSRQQQLIIYEGLYQDLIRDAEPMREKAEREPAPSRRVAERFEDNKAADPRAAMFVVKNRRVA